MRSRLKFHKSHAQQVALLIKRGMEIQSTASAEETLRRINYYRLSGYWYPFRQQTPAGRIDHFYPGTQFNDVVALYDFDQHLRDATFATLAPIELFVRTALGHELGRIDPYIHLRHDLLSPRANGRKYAIWRQRFEQDVNRSREKFVRHYRKSTMVDSPYGLP